MKKIVCATIVILLLIPASNAFAIDRGEHLNVPPPPAARELVKRAILQAQSDKPLTAITTLRRALSFAPNYLQAHIEYANVKSDYLNRSDEVDAEYLYLIRRFPHNPVYQMAFYFRFTGGDGQNSLQRVVDLAPEWAWGHYAKALLIIENDPEGAVVELQRCLERDGDALEAYITLIELQETRLHRIDDAIRSAEQLAAQTNIPASMRLQQLWRLRLIKNEKSDGAKAALSNQLFLLECTRDLETLLAIRSAYLNLLNNSERAEIIERRILALDSSWTPERGWPYRLITRNFSQVPRHVVLVNRQIALRDEVAVRAGATSVNKEERIVHLKELLSQQPNAAVRRLIYENIFRFGVSLGNATEVREFGRRLHALDPEDSALLSQMALVFSDKKVHLADALYYARKAEKLTAVFHRVRRPPNTSQMKFDFFFPEEKQREAYKRNRALALDALGWTLMQLGRTHQGVALLRQSVEIERSEKSLLHLAKALQQLDQHDEAATIENEANSFLVEMLRNKFTNEPIDDQQLTSIEGRTFNLTDQKGKVVLIGFWATWCVPCVAEMPFLKKLSEKYKEKGLEIFAVSTDEDLNKVRTFAIENDLNFPVVHSMSLGKYFNVDSIPASLFIDKHGKLRYRKIGFVEGDEREIEVVIRELLK